MLRRLAGNARRRVQRKLEKRRSGRPQRRRLLRQVAPHTPFLAVETGDLVFLVPTADRTLAKFWVDRSRKELRRLDLALRRLEGAGMQRRGDTFLDGGANIGTTTLAALRAGFSSALAFEPEPRNARVLRANIALNGAQDRVRVFELALSDTTATARLKVGAHSGGRSRLVAPDKEVKGATTHEVPTARLDDLVAQGAVEAAAIGLLWLDTEGHEWHVLSGAATLLGDAPPLVLELNPNLLRSSGGFEHLPQLLALHYTHVSDLDDPSDELRPVSALPAVFAQYAQEGHTDLLLCRVGRTSV